jgi:hypothetical protein
MVISVGVAAGLAAVAPFVLIAIGCGLIGFGGWVAGKKGVYEQPPSPDPLGGACPCSSPRIDALAGSRRIDPVGADNPVTAV